MRLKECYKNEIKPQLKEKIGVKNDFEIPEIKKVVINVGFGKRSKDKEFTDHLENTLTQIAGQKPVFTKARKSISSFKVRDGMVIGAKVTLRKDRMYDFLEKLLNITFARVRDFRGINIKGVDRSGNLTVGFKDNFPFPEIETQDIDKAYGLEVCVHTTAKTKEEGQELFKLFNFPFKNQ